MQIKLKKGICDRCGNEMQVFEEYEPIFCCDGNMCGCRGESINPVFCDDCEEEIYGVEC